jgi:hypothetical protein
LELALDRLVNRVTPKSAAAAGTAAVDATDDLQDLLIAVLLGMGLGGFCSVVGGMDVVPVSYMRVVRRLLMVSGFMMLGGFLVMMGRMLMMLGSLGVVVRSFLRHR